MEYRLHTQRRLSNIKNIHRKRNKQQYDRCPNQHRHNNPHRATCALIIDPSADIGVHQTYTTSTENGTNYITYTITATNNGPNNATNVITTDKLPTGLTYYQISLDGGNTWINSSPLYNKSTGTWNIGTLNNTNQTQTLMIKAIITGTGTIKNTVTKTQTEPDWNGDNKQQYTINKTIVNEK